jgi:hypothetical protein
LGKDGSFGTDGIFSCAVGTDAVLLVRTLVTNTFRPANDDVPAGAREETKPIMVGAGRACELLSTDVDVASVFREADIGR